MTELPRSTAALALVTFATLNALAWVVGVRLVAAVLDLAVPTTVLGTLAAVTGLAVPVALGGLRRTAPTA